MFICGLVLCLFRAKLGRSNQIGGLLVRDGRIFRCDNYTTVQDAHPDAVTVDWRGGFILPGLIDAHVHFPQVRIIGAMGRTLLDWLDAVALPEEARMADMGYAAETARLFLRGLASHGTKVRIDQGGPKGASGHVSSNQRRCVSGRRVVLFVEDEITGELERIGSASTDREGEWEVEEDLFEGDYIAKVAAKIFFFHGMRHSCAGGRSLKKHL